MTARGRNGTDKVRPGPQGDDELVEAAHREVLPVEASEQKESPGQSEKLMEQVADPANLNLAWQKVRSNGGAAGVDGVTIEAYPRLLEGRSEGLREELLEGRYRPSALRRVKIPKSNGGERLLGIPTVQDRLVQQALLQVLQPILDPTFSDRSYGFRPGRSAHQCVDAAQELIREGRDWVVDLDLEAFFDHVHHDRLMSRVGLHIADRRVRGIIRGFLRAGVMENGVTSATTEGTPQGGPLSPLLANLVLDELDKELERRGLRFVRYADDCNVYCGSEKAAAKAYENITAFIEGRLRLKVNREKSAVARPWQRKLLGFSFTAGNEAKRRIAPKSLAKAKDKLRKLTQKGHANFEATMASIRQYLLGWLGYYRHCQTPSVLKAMEEWVRRRLRCLIWRHWKVGPRRKAELIRRGVPADVAGQMAGSPQGAWHMSRTPPMSQSFTNRWFAAHGLPRFLTT